MIVCFATVRGGTCSYGGAWAAHVENDNGFRAIDLIYGVERKDVMKDRPPAERGDELCITVGDHELSEDRPRWRRWWGLQRPLKRIAAYGAKVTGGWPTTYPGYFPNYWYVTLRPELDFCAVHKEFSAQLGTLNMPFPIGKRVMVTIDLMNTNGRRMEAPMEAYTYSC